MSKKQETLALTVTVSASAAARIRREADAANMSVAAIVADVLEDVAAGIALWPEEEVSSHSRRL